MIFWLAALATRQVRHTLVPPCADPSRPWRGGGRSRLASCTGRCPARCASDSPGAAHTYAALHGPQPPVAGRGRSRPGGRPRAARSGEAGCVKMTCDTLFSLCDGTRLAPAAASSAPDDGNCRDSEACTRVFAEVSGTQTIRHQSCGALSARFFDLRTLREVLIL